MGKILDFLSKPMIQWDTKPKIVNNYYTTNNYYIHTENKIIKVSEQQFKKFIEKKKLEVIENGR